MIFFIHTFSNKKSITFHDLRNLIFGDYMGADDGPNKLYCEVKDMAELNMRMEEFLSEYNQQSRKPMDLVMFSFAIEHISRISRWVIHPSIIIRLLLVDHNMTSQLLTNAEYSRCPAAMPFWSVWVAVGDSQ